MLHITNGDASAEPLREARLGGEVLSWRDALHEGPVPADLSFRELSELRSRFMAERGWGPYEEILSEFTSREITLTRALEGDEIVLWFEHDLYDQLQLIQILSWVADHAASEPRLSLICIGSHPEVERFLGLGQLTCEQLARLFPSRQPVTTTQLDLARHAWTTFRAPVPTAVQELIRGDTSALPFLGTALRRHLEQFPSVTTGLSRTEMQVVEVIAAGVSRLDRIFRATQDLEEAPFLGDVVLWDCCSELASGPRPLLHTSDGSKIGSPRDAAERSRSVQLTSWGNRVRRREADWIHLRGGLDRWLGGVHLTGDDAAWRWDADAELLVGT